LFNVGTFELVALAVIALLVFGPEKLPKVAADAARLLRELRQMATGARRELSEALGPEFDEFKSLSNISDLNPRTFVKKNLLDVIDDDAPAAGSGSGTAAPPAPAAPPPSSGNRGSGRSGAGGAAEGSTGGRAPRTSTGSSPGQGYDDDTT
jgi:sec-independent protein translocase protein TatB